MKLFPRLIARRSAVVALLAALLLPWLWDTSATRAATVQFGAAYMAQLPGPNETPYRTFPSGTTDVFFDYAVSTASSTDTAEVDIYVDNTGGPPILTRPLTLSAPGSYFIDLRPGAGMWSDGGYCTVVKINGVPDNINQQLPIAWTVGGTPVPGCQNPPPEQQYFTATPTAFPTSTPTPSQTPTATPNVTNTPTETPTLGPPPPPDTPVPTNTATPTVLPTAAPTITPLPDPTAISEPLRHFVLTIGTTLHVHRRGTLRVYVHGTRGRAIAGATVTLNGRKVGLKKLIVRTSDRHGLASFSGLRPSKTGVVTVDATASGWATATIGLVVQQ